MLAGNPAQQVDVVDCGIDEITAGPAHVVNRWRRGFAAPAHKKSQVTDLAAAHRLLQQADIRIEAPVEAQHEGDRLFGKHIHAAVDPLQCQIKRLFAIYCLARFRAGFHVFQMRVGWRRDNRSFHPVVGQHMFQFVLGLAAIGRHGLFG